MEDSDFRQGLKRATKEFQQHAKDFQNSYDTMANSMRDSEMNSIRRGLKDQEDALDRRANLFKRFYKKFNRESDRNSRTFMNKLKTTVSVNATKIFKKFNKSATDSMNEFKNTTEDTFEDVEKRFSSLSDTLGKLSIASDLGDVKSGLEDTVKSNMEIRQELQRIAGVNDDSYDKLTKIARDFSKSTGNKISSNEYLSSLADLMKSTGIKDTDLATKFNNYVVKGSKALDVSSDSFDKVIESIQKMKMDPKYVGQLSNQLMGIGQNYETDPSKILETVNDNVESIRDASGGDQTKFKSMMDDFTATVSAIEDGWGDSGKMVDILKEIKNASPQDLGELSQKYAGLNVMQVQKMMKEGDFSNAATTMIGQIGKAVSDPSMSNYWKNIMGDSFTDFKSIYQSQGVEGFKNQVGNVKKTMADSVNKDLVQKYSDEMVVGWFDRFKNYIGGTAIGSGISNAMSSMGLDTGDVLMAGSLLAGSKLGSKALGKAGGAILGKFGLGKATAEVAEGVGASGAGAGLGSAIGGGLSSVAGGLGATATGAGAVALGGGAVAGGLAGAGGIIDGVSDLWNAHKEQNADKKKEKYWQGGSKLAMVGGGAATGAAIGSVIPVVGTAVGGLIGAGIGGIGALFKGDDVGTALSGVEDSKDNLSDTTDAIKGDMSYQDMAKSYKPMKEEFDKSLDDMSKSYTSFSKNIESNPPTVAVQDGGSSSGSSSSGGKKFKWWNPFTWFSSDSSDSDNGSDSQVDGSHKNGLDRVPFDGYKAELHKDEAVLTANQAKDWRQGQASVSATNFLSGIFQSLKPSIGKLDLSGLSGPTTPGDESVGSGGQQASQLTGDHKDFITKITPGSLKAHSKYNILPSLTMSQAILESGWGKSAIGNNIFGIKAFSDWKGKKKKVWTTEYNSDGSSYKTQAWFRDYDSIDDSILDHSKLLTNKRYAKVREATTYKQATKAVRDAGYATDPNYPNLLNQIIEENGLAKYDKKGMNAYAQGTPWVPSDQVALIHQDEMVVPKDKNPLVNGSVSVPLGSSNNGDSDKILQLVEWGFNKVIKTLENTSQSSNEQPKSKPMSSKSAEVFAFPG